MGVIVLPKLYNPLLNVLRENSWKTVTQQWLYLVILKVFSYLDDSTILWKHSLEIIGKTWKRFTLISAFSDSNSYKSGVSFKIGKSRKNYPWTDLKHTAKPLIQSP